MKTCTVCEIEQDDTMFYLYGRGSITRAKICKTCANANKLKRHNENEIVRTKANASCRAFNKTLTSEYRKNKRLKEKYNITLIEYNSMLDKQNKCCAVCGNQEKLVVDHNHKTGEIRALLCHHCNVAIGYVRENTNTLLKMISYLEVHNKTAAT